MSTSYYYFAAPVTSVRVESNARHDRVTVFQNGANAGTLTVDAGLGKWFAMRFADATDDDSKAPMRTHFGGTSVGCVITENVRGLDPALTLISEYGEPMTVAEVRAMAGRGRALEQRG